MSTNQHTQALILLCQSLAAEGKKPSVGLLRSKATFKVSVTDAIEAIKYYNAQQPKDVTNERAKVAEQRSTVSLEERVVALENRNKQLEERLALVEALIKNKTHIAE